MIATIYMLTVMFFSIVLEVLLGAYGFWIPVSGYVVFYIAVTYRWQIGISAALLSGMCIDLLYFRTYMYTALLFVCIVVIAEIWLAQSDDKAWWMRAVPGTLIGGVYVIPQALYNCFALGTYPDLFLRNYLASVFVIVLSGAALPFVISVLDDVAERLRAPRFCKAREKIIHSR